VWCAGGEGVRSERTASSVFGVRRRRRGTREEADLKVSVRPHGRAVPTWGSVSSGSFAGRNRTSSAKRSSTTRLETRTKESNVRASLRERNPRTQRKRTNLRKREDGGDLVRIEGRPGADPVESERVRWDPKDGELSMSRMRPEETLVEVRSGTDVQIVRLTCV